MFTVWYNGIRTGWRVQAVVENLDTLFVELAFLGIQQPTLDWGVPIVYRSHTVMVLDNTKAWSEGCPKPKPEVRSEIPGYVQVWP